MSHSTEAVRNIALAGHAGAGKTTLFEALLHAGGTIQTAGTIERGSTVSDFDPMEKERKHSIQASIASITRGECHVNLIDTPGYSDFRGPTLSALAAVETCAIVVNATNGIEHATRRMMDYARDRGLARVLVINRIDTECNLSALVEELREEFGTECLPINLPSGNASAVADCFFKPDGDSDFSSVAEAHQRIIDQVVEINETVMDHYLDLKAKAGSREANFTMPSSNACARVIWFRSVSSPRAAVPAYPNLLNLIERLLPNPREGNPPPFVKGSGSQAQPITAEADPGKHVIADVFKIVNDPFVGKLSVFRIYQGTVKSRHAVVHRRWQEAVQGGAPVPHPGQGPSRDRFCGCRATSRQWPRSMKSTSTRCCMIPTTRTRSTSSRWISRPMFGLAIEPAHKGQEQKLATALRAERGRSLLSRRAQQGTQRNRDSRPFRPAPETDAGAHEGALRRSRSSHARRALPIARPLRQGRRPPSPQEANRWRRPVRRSVPAHRALAARQRFRVRRRDQGRRDPEPVHARHRERRAPGARSRRGGRLSRCRMCAWS
jgi:elongation factor G